MTASSDEHHQFRSVSVELPTPGSRTAVLWTELLLPIYLQRFPHLRHVAEDHCTNLVNNFLEVLHGYYATASPSPVPTRDQSNE